MRLIANNNIRVFPCIIVSMFVMIQQDNPLMIVSLMVASKGTFILLLLCLNSGWLCAVKVDSSCNGRGDCVDVAMVLSNLSSNTTVELLEGDYIIESSILVENLSNISIVGVGANVVLSCSEATGGISFVNVDELLIRNLAMYSCTTDQFTVNYIPQVSTGLSYSIMISSCTNVVIENAVVSDSSAIGLVVINVMETFSTSEVNFTGNVGGGLVVMFFEPTSQNNTQIDISRCWFRNNTNLPLESGRQSSATGGGLTLVLAQRAHDVQANLVDSHFVDNIGEYGGGAHVELFSGVTDSSVHFSNCSFRYNSATLGGGGLFVLTEVTSEQFCSSHSLSNFEVTLSNSSFLGNQAYDGGAIKVSSLHPTSAFVGLYSVVIGNNSAQKASAVSIHQDLNKGGLNNNIEVAFCNCTIRNNFPPEFPVKLAAALIIDGAKALQMSQNSILGTIGSAVMIKNGGQLQVQGSTMIAGNHGINGGALHLSDISTIILFNNSRLDLIRNVAVLSGGAVYVQDCSNSSCCFIEPEQAQFHDCKFTGNFHTTINFHDNYAHKAEAIYGSTLKKCNWNLDRDIYPNFYTSCKGRHFMVFDGGNNQFETTSKLQINGPDSYDAKPGSMIQVPIRSRDEFGQPVEDTLVHRIINGNFSYESTQVISRERSSASVSVFGAQNETIDVEIFSSQTLDSLQITVYLENCGLGYWYNESTKSCACSKAFGRRGIQCTPENITVPEDIWLGVAPNKSTLVWAYCSREFCSKGYTRIVGSDFDRQCTSNRSGILCSKCSHNFSAVLGSPETCKNCSNTSIALIIGVLLFGITIILGITLCRADISQGYITSIIFYCNVLSVCGENFVPLDWRIIFVGADLLSLKLNLNACFYAGMTNLGATMIQYAFIGYMLFLVCVACLIISRITLPESHANTPTKVIPTVFLLCQVALMELCVSSLSYVSLRTLNNTVVQYRWLVSPDLAYVKSLHALPFSFALVSILILLLPFTVVISYPPWTYRITLLAKLKPVYDAMWAPFKVKYHWWFILRLVLRWIIYICATSLRINESNFSLGLILLLLFFLQVRIKPFVIEWNNTLDDSLLLVITLMALGGLYFPPFHSDSWLIYILILTSCFYGIVLVVVLIHGYTIFPILLNDLSNLHQFLRINVGKCCVRRPFLLMEEVHDPPQVSSTEVTVAGLHDGLNLNDNVIVDTAGVPVPDISTMGPVPPELDQGTNGEHSMKLFLEDDSLVGGNPREEQFYTCKGSENSVIP